MKPMLAVFEPATVTVLTYLVYLGISVAMTVWVARTLHKNGRIFLVESFLGKEALADSVNHLLVVGFYLINIGFVTLRSEEHTSELQSHSDLVCRLLLEKK